MRIRPYQIYSLIISSTWEYLFLASIDLWADSFDVLQDQANINIVLNHVRFDRLNNFSAGEAIENFRRETEAIWLSVWAPIVWVRFETYG